MPFDIGSIRNVAVIAHGGAGKTSLVEAMLFDSGSIDRLGSALEGTTTTDFEPEEIQRKITIISSLAFLSWKDHRVNLMDTPGFINFIEDARGSLRVADGAVVIVSALSGVKGETEKLWNYVDEFNIPRVVFVNKMDRESASFLMALRDLEKVFGTEAIPLAMPLGEGEGLQGVVDLIGMKAYKFDGGMAVESEIPPEAKDAAGEYRKKLVEKAAEFDDALLEKYLEGGELSNEEIKRGLRKGSLERKYIPVICGSAVKNIGVHQLLDAMALCLASPADMAGIMPAKGKNPKDGSEIQRKPDEKEPFSAYVFKTIADPFAGKLSMFRVYSGTLKADSNAYNTVTGARERIGQIFYLQGKKQVPAQSVGPGEIAVVAKLKETNTGDTLSDESGPIVFDKMKFAEPMISYAIEPKSRGDEDKVSTGIQRILDEDPTLRFHRDEETKEMLISGMGQVHLEVTMERLKRKFGVEVLMKSPKIPYKETIKAAARAQGRYKKQSGGKGQYGDCWIEVEPLPKGGGFEFVNKVVGGAIPRQYIPAIEKGIVEAMREGITAGYPLVDIKVTVYDGSYHAVDSSEMAFKIAGSFAIKKAAVDARPIILEPVMKVEVTLPEESLGAVIGDLNSKRGKVQGMEQARGSQRVAALVPMAEMLTYATQLHSLTSGRGVYSMEFSSYEEVPAHIAQKLIAERQKKAEEK
ncbi:MAG: elongation factor G [Thermodesulfovibrionales bacterium]|nr:elongation factor G [Thermodesulfovibrionales bacterium]